jgi:stage III sporulation protein AH
MINKKSLWFLTLFSLILVLSVYYVTMPSELLLTNNNDHTENENNEPTAKIEDSEILTALRVESNEQMLKELDELKIILTDIDATIDQKNNAFEKMKLLNVNRGEEEKLENKILEEFKLKTFIKIDGDQIRVVVAKEKHDATIANNIMRSIQSNYDKKMYISVKFQK